MGHVASVAVVLLRFDCAEAAIDERQTHECGHVPTNLYWQKQAVGQIWPGCSLLIPGLNRWARLEVGLRRTGQAKLF